MRRGKPGAPMFRSGSALKSTIYLDQPYRPPPDGESSSSSDSDSDLEDRRPRKKVFVEPPSSATTHVSETPDLNTHMAGHTPAATKFDLGSFGEDTTQDTSKLSDATPTAPLAANANIRSLPAASLLKDDAMRILEDYDEYTEVEEVEPTFHPYLAPNTLSTAPSIPSLSSSPFLSSSYKDLFEEPGSHSIHTSSQTSQSIQRQVVNPLLPSPPKQSNVDEGSNGVARETFLEEEAESAPVRSFPNHHGSNLPGGQTPTHHAVRTSPFQSTSPHLSISPQHLPSTPPNPQRPLQPASNALFRTPLQPPPPAPQQQQQHHHHQQRGSSPLRSHVDDSFMGTQDQTQSEMGRRRIPGPAGQLPPLKSVKQMQELEQTLQSTQAARPTQAQQQNARSSHSQRHEDQADFRNGAWLGMLCDLDLAPYGNKLLSTSLAWINNNGWKAPVPSLIVYVKSFKLIEDDYRAVLRDPTGAMEGCVIARSVADKHPDFTLGCVMRLQNVAVFTPSPGKHHLAILPDNIAQIWPRIDTPRSELLALSARVYTYNCIYDPSSLPHSVAPPPKPPQAPVSTAELQISNLQPLPLNPIVSSTNNYPTISAANGTIASFSRRR